MKYFYMECNDQAPNPLGTFFEKNNYRVFSWKQVEDYGVSERWFYGKWVELLDSGIFEEFDVFEDGPFFDPNFVAFLSNNTEKTTLCISSARQKIGIKAWSHTSGLSLGDLKRHAYIYDRLGKWLSLREKLEPDFKVANYWNEGSLRSRLQKA